MVIVSRFSQSVQPRLLKSSGLRSLLKTVSSVGFIEIIAGIQIVMAADLKPNSFIPGSDHQGFTNVFSWSIFSTF